MMALRSSWFCFACVYSCVFLASSSASAVDTNTRDKQTGFDLGYRPRHATRTRFRKSKINNFGLSQWYRDSKNVSSPALRFRKPLQYNAIKHKFPTGTSARKQRTKLENLKDDVKSKNGAIEFGVRRLTPQTREVSLSSVKDITEPGNKENNDSLSKEMDEIEIVDDSIKTERNTSFMFGEELSVVEKVDDVTDDKTLATSEILTDEPNNNSNKVFSVNVKHSTPLTNDFLTYQTNNIQTKSESESFTSKNNGNTGNTGTSKQSGCSDVFKCKCKQQKRLKQGVRSELERKNDQNVVHSDNLEINPNVEVTLSALKGSMKSITKHRDEMKLLATKGSKPTGFVDDVRDVNRPHKFENLPATSQEHLNFLRRLIPMWNRRLIDWERRPSRVWDNAARENATKDLANSSFYHLQNTTENSVRMIKKTKGEKAYSINAPVKLKDHIYFYLNKNTSEVKSGFTFTGLPNNSANGYKYYNPMKLMCVTTSKWQNTKCKHFNITTYKSHAFGSEKLNNFTAKKEHTRENRTLIASVRRPTNNNDSISSNFDNFSISSKTSSRPRTSKSQRNKAFIRIFAKTPEFTSYQTSDNVQELPTATFQQNRNISLSTNSQQRKHHSISETKSMYLKHREKFNAKCSHMLSNTTNCTSEDHRTGNLLELRQQASLTSKIAKNDSTIKTKKNDSSHSPFQKSQNASGEALASQNKVRNAGSFHTDSEGKPVKENRNNGKVTNPHTVNGAMQIPKVDGGFTNWSRWSACSHTCGRAKKVRVRFCIDPVPRAGGQDCRGARIQTKSCRFRHCTNQIYSADNLTSWEEWSTCSKTCGEDGVQTRKFCVLVDPEKRCKVEKRICKLKPCPDLLSSWSRWSSCSRTCGVGLQRRSRRCPSPEVGYERKNCSEVKLCNSRCPVHGGFSEWSLWSPCNGCLENAFRSRRRYCSRPRPAFGGNNCTGETSETKRCWRPCKVDNRSSGPTAGLKSDVKDVGQLTEWTSWSPCKGCGYHTLQTRRRFCGSPSLGYQGNTCSGQTLQTRSCRKSCKVDGGFSTWSPWSTCSSSCGSHGYSLRHRSCTNPSPVHGGLVCIGQRFESKSCNKKNCLEPSVFDIDPKDYCGFNPCEEVKCFATLLARCITDFDCNPLFFDQHGNTIKTCQGRSLYTTIPTELCGYNVCDFTKCKKPESLRCEVDLKCSPTFLDVNGKEYKCKGKNMVKVSPQSVCGFQPCRQHKCRDYPESVCVTDNRCKPVFLDSQSKPIKQCLKGPLGLKYTDLDKNGIEQALKSDITSGPVSNKLSWNTHYTNKINVKEILNGKKLFAPHESVELGDFYDGLLEEQDEDVDNDNLDGENEKEPDSTEELEVSPYEEEDEDYLEDRPRSDIDDID